MLFSGVGCKSEEAITRRCAGAIDQVTPFGLMRLPTRVVRERGAEKGGYLTLSKALLKLKATRLLSPWIEKRALEAATCLNYRPAASPLAWTNRKCVFRKF